MTVEKNVEVNATDEAIEWLIKKDLIQTEQDQRVIDDEPKLK